MSFEAMINTFREQVDFSARFPWLNAKNVSIVFDAAKTNPSIDQLVSKINEVVGRLDDPNNTAEKILQRKTQYSSGINALFRKSISRENEYSLKTLKSIFKNLPGSVKLQPKSQIVAQGVSSASSSQLIAASCSAVSTPIIHSTSSFAFSQNHITSHQMRPVSGSESAGVRRNCMQRTIEKIKPYSLDILATIACSATVFFIPGLALFIGGSYAAHRIYKLF